MDLDMGLDAVLERAADLIDEFGWGQGAGAAGPKLGFCAVTAIKRSCFMDDVVAREALSAVIEAAGLEVPSGVRGLHWGAPLWTWNDWPGRTAGEVTALLRGVAATYRASRGRVEAALERVCEEVA